MRNYVDYAYLHSRICALRSRLLTLNDYNAILRDPAALGGGEATPFNPTAAKEQVFRTQIAGILELVALSPHYMPLFLAFLRQYEVQNAKLLLVKSYGHASLEAWYDISPHAILDRRLSWQHLDLADLIAISAGTYLEELFTHGAGLERLLIGCDNLVVRNLHTAANTLLPAARADFQDMVLRRLAVMFVIWRVRLSQNHGWSAENIQAYFESINQFGDLRSHVRVVEEALSRHLEALRKGAASPPSVVDIEHYLEQHFYQTACALFHRDFHSGYVVAAYLWFLFIQIRNLFRIIDGRSFGLSAAAIRIISGV